MLSIQRILVTLCVQLNMAPIVDECNSHSCVPSNSHQEMETAETSAASALLK
jgi:hypothetical protein